MSHYFFHRDAAGKIIIKPKQKWYSVKQTASILSVSSVTAWRFIDQKKLEAKRSGGRWCVHYDALIAYLTESTKGGETHMRT